MRLLRDRRISGREIEPEHDRIVQRWESFMLAFTAPFSPPPSLRSSEPLPKNAVDRPSGLTLWLFVGTLIVILVPAARGGSALGATLPFWLIAAPLIGLAWTHRRAILRHIAGSASIPRRSRRMARRQPRHQRRVRSVSACSAERS